MCFHRVCVFFGLPVIDRRPRISACFVDYGVSLELGVAMGMQKIGFSFLGALETIPRANLR